MSGSGDVVLYSCKSYQAAFAKVDLMPWLIPADILTRHFSHNGDVSNSFYALCHFFLSLGATTWDVSSSEWSPKYLKPTLVPE